MEQSFKVFIFLVLTFVFSSCHQKNEMPNVVFILVDDLGWTDTSSYGSEYYETPNIDELAKKGVKFTNAYAASNVCSPTRASIITGKYPASLHLTDFIPGKTEPNTILLPPNWTKYLDNSQQTIADILKENGYATAHIGKWHLGKEDIYWPKNFGFDINIGGWSSGQPIKNNNKNINGYFSPYGNPQLEDGQVGEYLTNRLANEAAQYIKQNKSKPFFLNLWFYSVHTPLQAQEDKIQKYKAKINTSKNHKNPTYAAMIEHMDDAVGKTIKTLKEYHLDTNTIIVFTSDNGGLVGNHPRFVEKVTSNYPLKSGKGDMYEGGIRVPTIIYYPSKIKPKVEDTPIMSIDFLPTLLELTQVKNVDKSEFEGVSLAKLLIDNEEIKNRPLFWHYPHYHTEGAVPYSAVRFNNYKLIHNLENDELELYNLNYDLGEKNNIAHKNLEITYYLYNMLQKWKKKINAQEPIVNPNY